MSIETPINRECIENVLDAAHDVLGDFDQYGAVLQVGRDDEDGHYGPTSPIETLRTAVNALELEWRFT